jgi:hypothetical protein
VIDDSNTIQRSAEEIFSGVLKCCCEDGFDAIQRSMTTSRPHFLRHFDAQLDGL